MTKNNGTISRFLIILGILLLLIADLCIAQTYDQSGGVRLGGTSGLTYKKFLMPEEAVEFMMSGRNEGVQVSALYVSHKPMEFSFNRNFFAYYGLGGHFGVEKFDHLSKAIVPGVEGNPDSFIFEVKSYFVMGADALLGIEYRWLSVPITISFDLRPYFNFIGMRYTQSKFWDAAVSFKYVF